MGLETRCMAYCMIELTVEIQKQQTEEFHYSRSGVLRSPRFCYADSGPNRTVECLNHRSNGGECQFHPALQQLPAIIESLEQFGLQETIKSYGKWVEFSVCHIGVVRDEIALMQTIEQHIRECGEKHETWVFFESVKQECASFDGIEQQVQEVLT